jgi:hypothetical protein
MTILGIDTLAYGVDDVAACTRFFLDFGLQLELGSSELSVFTLAEGSRIEIRHSTDATLPTSLISGQGVKEVIWGVDDHKELDRLTRRVERHLQVRRTADTAVHFVPEFGIPMALRVFQKKPVVYAPDPLNAPGYVNRLNQHRKWRRRAQPKILQHVGFQLVDYQLAGEFMEDCLEFRLTDIQDNFALYLRASGTNNHHNLALVNAALPMFDADRATRFHHANFGVEDIDEIMIGVNGMLRKGWKPSEIGLGRHRVDSALFYYFPCPTGGEAEYGADADCVDDNWVPRHWTAPLFGYSHFTHNIPQFLRDEPAWNVSYLTEGTLRGFRNRR